MAPVGRRPGEVSEGPPRRGVGLPPGHPCHRQAARATTYSITTQPASLLKMQPRFRCSELDLRGPSNGLTI
eukprot:13485451-Alexandrium_andersonii.AAC.1